VFAEYASRINPDARKQKERRRWVIPCDTIQRTSVDLGKVDKDLLKLAMVELGFGLYTYSAVTGTLTVPGRDLDLNQVKREYSRQVVISQAKRFGWQFTEKAPGQFQVVKAGRI